MLKRWMTIPLCGMICLIDLLNDTITSTDLKKTISRGRAVAARQAHNLKVVGSNPTPATKRLHMFVESFAFKTELIMKYFVYCIKSQVKEFKYIGYCADLEARLKRHNGGYVRSTKAYRPYYFIAIREFESEIESIEYERLLKKNRTVKEKFLLNHKFESN